MNDADTIRFIRQEIARQVNIILSGRTAGATTETENIEELFPGMSTITERPVMHPYGLSSAAVDGTISVVARQGEHIGNRLVLGHRDSNRPSVSPGEVILYDAFGGKLSFKQSTVTLEKNEQELWEILIRLVRVIINARTNTIFGPQPLIPDVTFGQADTFLQVHEDLQTMRGE